MKTIKQIRERLDKKLDGYQRHCVKEAWNLKKDDWNPEHFKYCNADVVSQKLAHHDLLVKKFKEMIGERKQNMSNPSEEDKEKVKERLLELDLILSQLEEPSGEEKK